MGLWYPISVTLPVLKPSLHVSIPVPPELVEISLSMVGQVVCSLDYHAGGWRKFKFNKILISGISVH